MRYRFARIGDFTRCIDLIHNSLTDRPHLRQRLPEVRSSLFRAGSLLSAVIEDVSLPEAERLLAIYLAAFVADNHVGGLLASPRPREVMRLYERIVAGDSPVLTPERIRAAISGRGLNCLMRRTGMRSTGTSVDRRLTESLRDVCVLLRAGYRTRMVMEEVLGTRARIAREQSGFRLATDFPRHYRAAAPPPEDHPYLFVAAAEEQYPGIVSGCSFEFNCGDLQFDFAPVQQKLLLHVLFNESDEEIADRSPFPSKRFATTGDRYTGTFWRSPPGSSRANAEPPMRVDLRSAATCRASCACTRTRCARACERAAGGRARRCLPRDRRRNGSRHPAEGHSSDRMKSHSALATGMIDSRLPR